MSIPESASSCRGRGAWLTELRYYAYGGTRYDAGGQLTLYRYTGQRIETGTGLYDHGARWFDPAIGRFLAADSIVPNPGDSQALNRYMYVLGNPLKYSDPSGHAACAGDDRACWENEWYWNNRWYEAHGYYFNGASGDWSIPGPNHFADASIAVEWLIERMLQDATSATVVQLRDINSSIGTKMDAYGLWMSMVKARAPWDYKGLVYDTFGPNVEVRGVWYLFDILGNIHYGFVGKAAGFSNLELKKGAGAANFVDNYRNAEYRRQVIGGGWWKSNFDDPSDQAAIGIGMDLYRSYQLDVTPSRFYEVFSRYEHLLTRAIPQYATPATR